MAVFLSENENELILSRRFAFSESDKVLFEKMYRDYDRELGLYSERLRQSPINNVDFKDMYSNIFLAKMFILTETKQKAGFCLLGFAENTHPATNYYIAEFYISPEFRRKGIGKRAVKELFALLPGKYCYHVLKQNDAARCFWENVKNECRCQSFLLEDTLNLEDCDFYGFKTLN